MLSKSTYLSPLGAMDIVCTEKEVKGVWFQNQTYYGADYDLTLNEDIGNSVTSQVEKWLDAYFSGKQPSLNHLSLSPEVTCYRQRVLNILKNIDYHKIMTYQEVATELERQEGNYKTSPRAVGGAVGHNPISILIPCHRVIGSNGFLTGYAGGIERKIELLALEGFSRAELATLYIKR